MDDNEREDEATGFERVVDATWHTGGIASADGAWFFTVGDSEPISLEEALTSIYDVTEIGEVAGKDE